MSEQHRSAYNRFRAAALAMVASAPMVISVLTAVAPEASAAPNRQTYVQPAPQRAAPLPASQDGGQSRVIHAPAKPQESATQWTDTARGYRTMNQNTGVAVQAPDGGYYYGALRVRTDNAGNLHSDIFDARTNKPIAEGSSYYLKGTGPHGEKMDGIYVRKGNQVMSAGGVQVGIHDRSQEVAGEKGHDQGRTGQVKTKHVDETDRNHQQFQKALVDCLDEKAPLPPKLKEGETRQIKDHRIVTEHGKPHRVEEDHQFSYKVGEGPSKEGKPVRIATFDREDFGGKKYHMEFFKDDKNQLRLHAVATAKSGQVEEANLVVNANGRLIGAGAGIFTQVYNQIVFESGNMIAVVKQTPPSAAVQPPASPPPGAPVETTTRHGNGGTARGGLRGLYDLCCDKIAEAINGLSAKMDTGNGNLKELTVAVGSISSQLQKFTLAIGLSQAGSNTVVVNAIKDAGHEEAAAIRKASIKNERDILTAAAIIGGSILTGLLGGALLLRRRYGGPIDPNRLEGNAGGGPDPHGGGGGDPGGRGGRGAPQGGPWGAGGRPVPPPVRQASANDRDSGRRQQVVQPQDLSVTLAAGFGAGVVAQKLARGVALESKTVGSHGRAIEMRQAGDELVVRLSTKPLWLTFTQEQNGAYLVKAHGAGVGRKEVSARLNADGTADILSAEATPRAEKAILRAITQTAMTLRAEAQLGPVAQQQQPVQAGSLADFMRMGKDSQIVVPAAIAPAVPHAPRNRGGQPGFVPVMDTSPRPQGVALN